MAVLLDNITNYIWHAFDFLQQKNKSGYVHKSKLKVLTANIGTILDLYGVEKGLDHYRSTPTLNFDQFKFYLQKEVFVSLPLKLPLSELHNFETRISETCWLICKKKYQNFDNEIFGEIDLFRLFRIFCVLSDLIVSTDLDNSNSYQVLLHSSEVENISQTLAQSLGCPWDEEDFSSLCISIESFRFLPFITILESKCLGGVKDNVAISEAIFDIYQTIVEDVIKKGYLTKKGYIFPTMREYWFVLRPSELTFYKNRNEKICCGSLLIEPNSRIEPKAGYKIHLHTPERSFELGTSNHMSRLQWISALQLAADHSGNCQTYQRLQAAKRHVQRQTKVQEIITTKMQLQKEKNARKAAEGQAKELEAVVKEETKKLNQLEQLKENLERLLEEETQAKRDEEIVRTLQARVLTEEWEKREQLEKLQLEQKLLLQQERQKFEEFKELQKLKEKQLKDAENRLGQLEKELEELDEKLKLAQVKVKTSGDKKELIETKLYQVASNFKDNRVRRAYSFMSSTKERPVILEIPNLMIQNKKNKN